ncbi:BREX-1 system phosphatase PglZ type A [Bacillus cereus]|uniref:BREX-1 system phosphatase PglZ type A n=1 Tax=Bacillus cereus TaxID=1396 RepID=UPI0006A85E21|nr:BREX-1 system phosphatase PglZ type A [Bacillus cereus]MDA1817647.1 BREX-1 system phosphatase PglZ type A [Bacillus cereus]CUB36092.1 PglZ domain protein [Bacillus cereus]
MNTKEINRVLQDTFNKELTEGKKRHIVFWYDEAGEFIEDIDELNLEGVRIWKLTPHNMFATKLEVEKNDVNSNFLIYANMAKPSAREDWLLDVYKYSQEFATDKMTVMMRELGITNDAALRDVFKKYTKFFKSKEREALFKSFSVPEYTEEQIDLTVLASLCKCSIVNLDEIIKALFREQLKETNKYWESIQKFGDEETFWSLVEKTYGYNSQEKSINSLLIFFLLTNVSETLGGDIPKTWHPYISAMPMNAIVFMNQFMNHSADEVIYNELANTVEKQVKVTEHLQSKEIKDYITSDTFRCFDTSIITYITKQLMNAIHDYTSYIEIIAARRKLHWFSVFRNEYEALYQAIQLFQQIYEMGNAITESQPFDLFKAYESKYHNIDTAYRKFYVAFDQIEVKDGFRALRDKVENIYTNVYINDLAIKWSDVLVGEQEKYWPIAGLESQHTFYRSFVQPFVNKEERVFVIISDALRYEVAKELSNMLNVERKASTDIVAMQGVLPSYTDLGMATLLPYKSITFNENAEVYVNDYKASSTENRATILSNHYKDSTAIQYKDLVAMNRQQFRDVFSGKKVSYIYHNVIDARGDHAATEHEVFHAVEQTLKDIRSLVNQLINTVSASNIVITADHGFIYNRDTLQASDKVKKDFLNTDIEKRRFIISSESNSIEGTMNFSMDYVLGEGSRKYVKVPRGANRFAVQGTGANYVHGGAMLQEIVVPVIKFKNDRSKSSKNDVRKVEVKLTSLTRKITNSITYLEFFQTEKIEDKKTPLRLKVYFTDEEGNRISNENIIIADSQSSKPEDRTFKEKFVLKSMTYDKTKKYYLVLEDEEEAVENIYEKVAFTIDIAITNDFGF